MTRPARMEAGFTLIELLLAMTLMIVVLGATLNSWDGFLLRTSKNSRLQEQQDAVRLALDRMVTQLRNLANPATASQATIDFADDFKLIFQTTDPLKQWVMYCVASSPTAGVAATSGASTSNAQLWYQVSSSGGAVTAAMESGCPSTAAGWTSQELISRNVTNLYNGSRALFSYTSIDPNTGSVTGVPTPASAANRPKITTVGADLFLDLNPTQPPVETELKSGAYLRNQNQAPTARFGIASGGSSKAWIFTASGSSDPEQRTLLYNWYRTPGTPTSVPNPSTLPDCSVTPKGTVSSGGQVWSCIGTGAVLNRDFSKDTAPSQNVWLRVTDPGFLSDLSDLSAGGCAAQAVRTVQTDCAQVFSGPS